MRRTPIYMLLPLAAFFIIMGLFIVHSPNTEVKQSLFFVTVCAVFILCVCYVYSSWLPIVVYLPTLLFPAATLLGKLPVVNFIFFYCVIYAFLLLAHTRRTFSLFRTLHFIAAFSCISIFLLTYEDVFTGSSYLHVPVILLAIDTRLSIILFFSFMLFSYSLFKAPSPAAARAWRSPHLIYMKSGVLSYAINPLIDFVNVSVHLVVSVFDFLRRLCLYIFSYCRNAIKIFVLLGRRIFLLKHITTMARYFTWFFIVASFGYVASCSDMFIAEMFLSGHIAGFITFIGLGVLFALATYFSTRILVVHKVKPTIYHLHKEENLDRRVLEVLSVVIISFFISETAWFIMEIADIIERGKNPQAPYFMILSAIVVIPMLWWAVTSQNKVDTVDIPAKHNSNRQKTSVQNETCSPKTRTFFAKVKEKWAYYTE